MILVCSFYLHSIERINHFLELQSALTDFHHLVDGWSRSRTIRSRKRPRRIKTWMWMWMCMEPVRVQTKRKVEAEHTIREEHGKRTANTGDVWSDERYDVYGSDLYETRLFTAKSYSLIDILAAIYRAKWNKNRDDQDKPWPLFGDKRTFNSRHSLRFRHTSYPKTIN